VTLALRFVPHAVQLALAELPDGQWILLRRARFHVHCEVRLETLVLVAGWSAIRVHGPALGAG
jgi:hypothetical protein